MSDKLHGALVNLAMSMYADEPCRICGQNIEREDLPSLVYAGYSKNNEARSAHAECWNAHLPQRRWRYQ